MVYKASTQGRLRHIPSKWQLYLFLCVPLAFLIVFAYVPMGGLQLAFKDYDMRLGIMGSPWTGVKYFRRFFSSYQFMRVLTNTLSLSLYSLAVSFPLPILFALALNALPYRRYKKIIQTASYMPYFISTVVMVGILMQLFNPRIGIYGVTYRLLLGVEAPDLFGRAQAFPHLYVWSGIWQGLGWNSIIYFAALSNVDRALSEAAEIDGANRFQRIVHIDLPTILPTASIMLILATGSLMSVGFEKVYLLQNKLNLSTSEVISTYVYKVGMVTGGGDFSFATAIGMFNSVVNFTLIVLVNAVCKRLGGSSLW